MQQSSEGPGAVLVHANEATLKQRLIWLAVCMTLGLGVGFLGHHFTGEKSWFLALPISIAAGWLFLANPAKCDPRQDRQACGHDKRP